MFISHLAAVLFMALGGGTFQDFGDGGLFIPCTVRHK